MKTLSSVNASKWSAVISIKYLSMPTRVKGDMTGNMLPLSSNLVHYEKNDGFFLQEGSCERDCINVTSVQLT